MLSNNTEVIAFDVRYRQDFARLNYEWIETLFGVEAPDREILDHPEGSVLANGGQIFFIRVGELIAGTVALKRVDASSFELTKMAVDASHRGRGYSRLLLNAALVWAREQHAQQVVLYSHSSLTAAISLYRSAGFIDASTACNGGYARCDVAMVKTI